MRLAVLASGSSGNALLVEGGRTCVLVDCGLSRSQLEKRLAMVGRRLADIDAIVITHEHVDHVAGLRAVLRRHRVPLLASSGTVEALGWEVEAADVLSSGRSVTIGELRLLPVATSHDAREPIGFVVEGGGCRAAVVTDTGVATELIAERLAGCHALLVESNHDPDMLRWGPYPWPLKQRIASRTGHLSNLQALELIERVAHSGLEVVAGMHLSRENNRPELAAREISRPLTGSTVRVITADQDQPVVVEVNGGGPRRGQLELFATPRG